MFNLMRNIRRQGFKSLLVCFIGILLTLFLSLYLGNIAASRKELNHLPEVLPVASHITNISGSKSVGLLIDGGLIEKIKATNMVNNLRYTVQLSANFAPETPEEELGYKYIAIMGVNDISAFSLLSAEDIEWADGVAEDFLSGRQAGVIVQENFLENNDLNIGDRVWLSLYSIDYGEKLNEIYYKKIDDIALEIVGSYALNVTQFGEFILPDMICPVGWVEETLQEYDKKFYADSASFVVSDPLKLNDFKAAMRSFGFQPVNAQADSYSLSGFGLLVNDETFVRSAGSLQKNLTMMTVFLPLILLLIVLVGYIASYLVMQSRRSEVAVMRSLGVSQSRCILSLSAENALLVLLGCLVGLAAAVSFTGIGLSGALVITAVFFVSYMLGVVAALLKLSRMPVMEVLTKSE
ncbi:MAG: hypothetical protein LBM18_02855 [Oscillospiraceae bacterium]|jgi:hypothetical protein|nr:hypothetical protein [Oscillospiraceae bacterium]